MTARLNPYISFGADAREAMEFYKSVFGGELQMTTFGEAQMSEDPGDADKVMHSQLEAPNGMVLMGADTPSHMQGRRQEGSSISISLSGDDAAELRGYYEGLAEGGTVVVPLDKAPWGDWFGMCTDRFGVTWLVNIAGDGG